MNNPLHQHKWQTVSTNYTQPISGSQEYLAQHPEINGSTLNQEAISGVTRIYQQCEGCGAVQETSVLGHFKANGVEEVSN